MKEFFEKLASLLDSIYKYDRGHENYPWRIVRLELEEFYQVAQKFAGQDTKSIIIMFDCPVHGLETRVFCFRAFDVRNKDKYKKFDCVEVHLSDEDKVIVQNFMENK
jgi:hypothetical protein